MIPTKTHRRSATCLALALLVCAGCVQDRPGVLVSTRAITVAYGSPKEGRLWNAVQDALRERDLRIDRADRRAGVITTLPRTSQQVFEFWRNDVCTREDLWEATLNPIRRWVEVRLGRGDDGAWRDISVIVHKERFSSPDRQFNSTGASYQFFGDQLPATTGAARVTSKDDFWLDMGRDAALEDSLLKRIASQAGLPNPTASATTSEEPTP